MMEFLGAADAILQRLDGVAGLAALINGLLLWPVVKALKANDAHHDTRLAALEKQ